MGKREGDEGLGIWRCLCWAVVLTVVLVPAYCLSSGPAALLLCDTELGTRVWNWAYLPLLYMLDGTSARDAFMLYVNWCVNLDNPSGPYD